MECASKTSTFAPLFQLKYKMHENIKYLVVIFLISSFQCLLLYFHVYYLHVFPLQTDGSTVLHIACAENDEATVKYLYSVKANPNITDKVRTDYLLFFFTI